MTVDRAGVPFIGGAAGVGIALAVAGLSWAAALCGVLTGFFLFFFRDPDRVAPSGVTADAVLAPADGRVLHAGDAEPGVAPAGEWRQVSIFLSPLDVHVNRAPVGGRVLDVTHRPGRFLPAYDRRSAGDNERTEIRVESGGQIVVFRQVVGLLARRVVCRVQPGAAITRGERFGIMKFGSRMDLFLPRSATITVTVGQGVRGGETVVARLARAGDAPRGE